MYIYLYSSTIISTMYIEYVQYHNSLEKDTVYKPYQLRTLLSNTRPPFMKCSSMSEVLLYHVRIVDLVVCVQRV